MSVFGVFSAVLDQTRNLLGIDARALATIVSKKHDAIAGL